jgi:hypothetical protein
VADVKGENERSIERRLRVGNMRKCMVDDLSVATWALRSACVDKKTGQPPLGAGNYSSVCIVEMIRIVMWSLDASRR